MAVNPDLQKERISSNINVEELACVIHGGAEILTKRREIRKLPEVRCGFYSLRIIIVWYNNKLLIRWANVYLATVCTIIL